MLETCFFPGLVAGLKSLHSEDIWCARMWWYPTAPQRIWGPVLWWEITSSSPFGKFCQYVCLPVNIQRIFCTLSSYFHTSYPPSLMIMFLSLLLFSVICTSRVFMVVLFSGRENQAMRDRYYGLFWFHVDLLDSRDSWLQALESILRKECTVSSLKQ